MAVAFAGFAGLASIFEQSNAPRRPFDAFDRIAMIGFGVQAAGFALLPRIVAALGVAEPLAWRASGLATATSLLAWSLYGAWARRQIARQADASAREASDRLPRIGAVIGLSLFALFALRSAGSLPGIYVTTLFGMLVFASAYFLRTLIPRGP